ncbi:Beta-N-acetylglucosaminidase [Sphingobacterium sp. JB170]|nr:Beta-N-acetylglucosaminidase [Sphingobacterium sp. JB170]
MLRFFLILVSKYLIIIKTFLYLFTMTVNPRVFILVLFSLCSLGISGSYAQYKQTIQNETKILKQNGAIIPFTRLDEEKIVVITPSTQKYREFIETLSRYADVHNGDFAHYDDETKYFNTVIIAGTAADLRSDFMLKVRQSLVNNKQLILVRFEDNSVNNIWPDGQSFSNYTEVTYPSFSVSAQRNVAMSIFGGLAVTQGPNKTEQTRLQYTLGEDAGIDIAGMTTKIDAITAEGIKGRGAPGMVVMVVKDGQVIFEKGYGAHTYRGIVPTKKSDIFDMASISKIVGTTPVVMHLQETHAIDLDSTMGYYLWQAKQTNKKDIPLRSVLLHEAGFTPFIPFYRYLEPGDVVSQADSGHQVQLADGAYLRNNYYRDVMWPQMLASDVKPIGNYVYSDISMYVMKEVSEHITAVPMQDYIQKLLYQPIGMKTAGYNPRERFAKERMVPTENDTSFRKVLLQGFVHDQGAAMAGGVAGHAGVFASANDLAIYAQLLLNRGTYGGVQYFKPETVDMFTSKQSETSRRGLGFDRKDPDPAKEYPSLLAGESVYGHTGYTGTCIWIDPQNQLTYIFLSNRVHPQVTSNIYDMNIRSRIQDVIYETINKSK